MRSLDFAHNMDKQERKKLHKHLKEAALVKKDKGLSADDFVHAFKGLMSGR